MKIIPTPCKIQFKNEFTDNIPEEKCSINSSLENEEYTLSITNESINIEGGSEKAVFFAKQTLKQIKAQYDRLPICTVEDKPRYPHRAFMTTILRK